MMKYLSTAAVLLGITVVVGCNSDKKDDKKMATGGNASGFALKAEICGSYPSVADYSEKSGTRRQLSAELAMGICGKMDGTDDKKWNALGMSVTTPDVYIKKVGGNFEAAEENKAQLFLEGDSKVIAVAKNGKTYNVGTVDALKKAAKIKLVGGVALEMAVGNRQYQISDAKSVPDSEKKLFVSTND